MRSLNAAQLAEIAASDSRPLIIIEVAWNGYNKSAYADFTAPDNPTPYAPGRILELTGLDNVINISNNSVSQQLTIKLDDTNGTIFEIMKYNDVHLKPVWVYQWFEALSINDKFLLFKGYINSPLEWNEGDRTVSFTVLSKVDGPEVGFSPEEGLLQNLSDELVGEAWPMTFGTVKGVKAIRLTTLMAGTLADGFGIADFTLPSRAKAQLAIINYKKGGCVMNYLSQYLVLAGSDCEGDPSLYQEYLETLCTYDCQVATQRNTLRIIGGEYFPRGNITIRINDTYLTGYFISNTNIFQLSNIGNNYAINHPLYSKFIFYNQTQSSTTYLPATSCTCQTRVDNTKIKVYPYPILRKKAQEKEQTLIPSFSLPQYDYTGEIGGDTAGYVYNGPGTRVDLVTGRAQKYIVNMLPGIVESVYTYSTVNGNRFIVQLPTNLYTIGTMTFGPLTVTIIDIPTALSQINDTWQDDIYVNYKSNVGPNTVDIIEYLITTYLPDYTTDTSTFASVKTELQNLPSSFTLYERKEIFQLLQEIAFQAACALYIVNNKFYIKYLLTRYSAVATINKTDILLESLRIKHTITEDLVTKLILEWKSSDSSEEPNKIVLRHNVKKYGTKEETYQFYIYNWQYPILKHGTYWLIRKANTWKKAVFNTPLTKLALETFDYININLPNVLANTAVRSIIEQAIYDSEQHSIAFECWTPVKSGEMNEYIFAYPNAAVETDIFPTQAERLAGLLGSGSEFNQAVIGTLPDKNSLTNKFNVSGIDWGCGEWGDKSCLDCSQVKNIAACQSRSDKGQLNPGWAGGSASGGGGMSESYPSEGTGGSGAGAQTTDKDGVERYDKNDDLTAEELLGDLYSQHPLELPITPEASETCWYSVWVTFVNPVGLVHSGGIGCHDSTLTGECGTICTGPLEKSPEKYYFGSCSAAQSFADAMREYAATPACTGERHPHLVGGPLKMDLPIIGGCAGLEEREELCEGSYPKMIAFSPSEGTDWQDENGDDSWTKFANWSNANGYPDFM